MKTLMPWTAGWANLILPDGEQVWESAEYGNAPLVERLYEIATEVIDTLIPNAEDRESQIEYFVNEVFSHPSREAWGYDNPRQFDDVLGRFMEFYTTRNEYVAPSPNRVAYWKNAVHAPAPPTGSTLPTGAIANPADTDTAIPLTPSGGTTTPTVSKESNAGMLVAAAVVGYLLLKK